MLRAALRLFVLAGLATGGAMGAFWYQHHTAESQRIDQLERQQRLLEAQKKRLIEQARQLQTVVRRFSDEKRVAEVIVTHQQHTGSRVSTTLLFVEYGRDGNSLPARTFVIDGDTAHIDALVIKFNRDFVARDDPLKGHSIALFQRLYGESQSPASAFPIDPPGAVPDFYRDPSLSDAERQFQQKLWQDFWKLADDPEYAHQNGVRIANGQGIWGPFTSDRLYTITLESTGGLNLTSEPLKGIYREALKSHPSQGITRSE